jgi:SAM-dependent methyltransferase
VSTQLNLKNHGEGNQTMREMGPDEEKEFVVKNLRRWISAELEGLPRDSTILDVGCGDASVSRFLTGFSPDVTALHSSASQATQNAKLYPQISFVQHDMSDPIPFVDGSFNVIWCSGILENVPNPGFALREMYRILAPGGRLLVTVPYNSRIRDVFTPLLSWNQGSCAADAQLHFFTKHSLEKIASSAGFISLHLKTCSMYNRLHDLLIPTNILLTGEKSQFAPFTVTFDQSRRDQYHDRILRAVPSPAIAHA